MGCCGKAKTTFARMRMLPTATGQLTRMAPRGQLGPPIKATSLEPDFPWYRPPFVAVQPRQPVYVTTPVPFQARVQAANGELGVNLHTEPRPDSPILRQVANHGPPGLQTLMAFSWPLVRQTGIVQTDGACPQCEWWFVDVEDAGPGGVSWDRSLTGYMRAVGPQGERNMFPIGPPPAGPYMGPHGNGNGNGTGQVFRAAPRGALGIPPVEIETRPPVRVSPAVEVQPERRNVFLRGAPYLCNSMVNCPYFALPDAPRPYGYFSPGSAVHIMERRGDWVRVSIPHDPYGRSAAVDEYGRSIPGQVPGVTHPAWVRFSSLIPSDFMLHYEHTQTGQALRATPRGVVRASPVAIQTRPPPLDLLKPFEMWAELNSRAPRVPSTSIPRSALIEQLGSDSQVWRHPGHPKPGRYSLVRATTPDGLIHLGWIRSEDLAMPTGTGQALLRSAAVSPAFDVRALPRPGFDPLRPPPAPPILAPPPPPQPETNIRYVSFSGPGTHVQMWFRLNDPSSRAFAWIRRGSEVEISPSETDVEVRGGRGRPPIDPNVQYTRVVRHVGTDGRNYTGWIRTNELAFQPVGPGGQVLRPVSTGGQYPPWAYAG